MKTKAKFLSVKETTISFVEFVRKFSTNIRLWSILKSSVGKLVQFAHIAERRKPINATGRTSMDIMNVQNAIKCSQ